MSSSPSRHTGSTTHWQFIMPRIVLTRRILCILCSVLFLLGFLWSSSSSDSENLTWFSMAPPKKTLQARRQSMSQCNETRLSRGSSQNRTQGGESGQESQVRGGLRTCSSLVPRSLFLRLELAFNISGIRTTCIARLSVYIASLWSVLVLSRLGHSSLSPGSAPCLLFLPNVESIYM